MRTGRRFIHAALSVWVSACARDAVRCEEATAARDFARASDVCLAAFLKDKTPREGANAAMAALQLGKDGQALSLAEQLLATSQRATALRIVGVLRAKAGDANAAQAALGESLQLHLAAGNALESAKAAHTLAGQHWKSGAYGEALEALELALAQASLAKDERLLGFVSMAMGDLFYEVGDLRSAERALAKASAALRVSSPGDGAYVRFKEGLIHHDAGRPAMAQAAYAQALQLAEPAQRNDVVRAVHLRWAELDWQGQRYDEAERHLHSAQVLLDAREDADARTAWWYLRGILSLAEKQPGEAAKALDTALSRPGIPERRWRILNARAEVAEALGEQARAQAWYAQALEVIEGLRSGASSDELRTWLSATKRGPYEALFAAHARAGRTSQAVDVMAKMQARALGDAFLPLASGAETLEAEAGRRRLRALKPWAAPVMLDTVRIPPKSLVWAFVRAKGQWWRVELEGVHTRVVALGAATEVAPWVEVLRQNPLDMKARCALGHGLLPRSWTQKKGHRLFVIPDDGLTGISFASLVCGDSQEPLSLSYVPSVAMLWGMHQRESTERVLPAGMYVFGDPKGDLPGSAQEALAVAQALGVQAQRGALVTRQALQAARDAQVLHLSSHAGISSEGAWLELADGRWTVSDVREWQLHPRLTVLASCASAIGRAPALSGALSWAFLMSGSRSVLATLRAVEDRAAARFMDDFYRAGGAHAPAAALHRVQAQWAERGDSGDWTAFALFGLQ